MITLRYFIKGEESGELYTMEFNTIREYELFIEMFGEAIEEFDLMGV